MNSKGVIADVIILPEDGGIGGRGQYAGGGFLYSSGFS